MPAVLNAANEIAVHRFLQGEIVRVDELTEAQWAYLNDWSMLTAWDQGRGMAQEQKLDAFTELQFGISFLAYVAAFEREDGEPLRLRGFLTVQQVYYDYRDRLVLDPVVAPTAEDTPQTRETGTGRD